MLRFTATIDIISDRWSDEDEKKVFMENAEKIIQEGLFKMTVPDWEVNVIDVEEVDG